jgi:hypothetical protein
MFSIVAATSVPGAVRANDNAASSNAAIPTTSSSSSTVTVRVT